MSQVVTCYMFWLKKLVKHFVTCHKLSHVTCFGEKSEVKNFVTCHMLSHVICFD